MPAYRYRLQKAREASRLASQPTASFLAFKQAIYRRYEHAPHLALIDGLLMEAVRHVETGGRDGKAFVIIETPPRHGKTVNISRLFPAWYLGTHPDHRIIQASYGASLAVKNSRYTRNLIASDRYRALFPGIELAPDSKAADAWDIAGHEGGLDAMGVGGGVTGKGAQIVLIDDPVKSREEAESVVYRDKVWDWWSDDLFTRLEPGAAMILVMTRWHADDLAGRLLKNEPGKWTELRLPAIAEDNDPLGRNPGQALWPARYDEKALAAIQATLGDYAWSALYQQRPVPAEGGLFKRAWFEPLADSAPQLVGRVRYWDLAMSDKTSADFTVGALLGEGEDGHFYLLDVARRRLDWGDVVPFIAETMMSDGPDVAQGIEERGYMSRAVQDLNRDPRFRGYQVWGYPVDKDKVTRALPLAAKAGAGMVHVVNAYWTPALLEELLSFPAGAHDDQVDAVAGAYSMLSEGVFGGAVTMARFDTLSNA